MSPTRKPSTIAGLRNSMASDKKPVGEMSLAEIDAEVRATPAPPVKPARVTLNLPPELYRQLARWCDSAAETIGVPRVSQQDALRAMIRTVVLDESIGLVVTDLVRRDSES